MTRWFYVVFFVPVVVNCFFQVQSWHRVLKSGCRIEARQFGEFSRFVHTTSLFAVIAWRILYATILARLDGDLPCEVVLLPIE